MSWHIKNAFLFKKTQIRPVKTQALLWYNVLPSGTPDPLADQVVYCLMHYQRNNITRKKNQKNNQQEKEKQQTRSVEPEEEVEAESKWTAEKFVWLT